MQLVYKNTKNQKVIIELTMIGLHSTNRVRNLAQKVSKESIEF